VGVVHADRYATSCAAPNDPVHEHEAVLQELYEQDLAASQAGFVEYWEDR